MAKYHPKLIRNDSFSFGTDEPLVSIADNFSKWKKTASKSSPVVAEWGDIKPIPGHTLIHIIALGDYEKVGANSNGDAFREALNKRQHGDFMKYAALYRNHKVGNLKEGDDRREGFIHRTAHNDEMGRVELLLAADNKKCADWLTRIEEGKPVSFSMGFGCSKDQCSYCHEVFTEGPDSYCEHTRKKTAEENLLGIESPWGLRRLLPSGEMIFLDNLEGHWNDLSKVGIGADLTAFDLRKVASAATNQEDPGQLHWITESCARCERVDLAIELAALEHASQKSASSWVNRREVPQDVIDSFNAGDDPAAVFGWLNKHGIILPMPEFLKVASGGNWAAIEDDATAAWNSCLTSNEMFGRLDDLARQRIAANLSWEGDSSSYPQANAIQKEALMRNFSPLHCDFSNRLLEDLSNRIAKQKTASAIAPAGKALLEQYLAYRLSVIAANQNNPGFLVDSTFCH